MKLLLPHIIKSSRSLVFGTLCSVLSALAVTSAALAQGQNMEEGVFGTNEIRSADLSAFTKWTGMLARSTETAAGTTSQYADELAYSGRCKPNPRFPCRDQALDDLVRELSGKSTVEKLDGVNRFINQVRYITDDVNWGVADYWATPNEFFQMSGDCEDYAIAKFAALKRLGFDASTMRIVVLEDENLDTHHAVLIVETGQGRMVLDNQISQLILDTEIHHYRPIYSINETAWWLHVPAEGNAMLAQQNR